MTVIVDSEASARAAPCGEAFDREATIVAAVRRRDEPTLAALVVEHRDAMMRVARYYVADGATAEDVVQETWIAVLRGVDRFDQRASLKTWIFRILVNRAKTMGIRQSRVVPVELLSSGDAMTASADFGASVDSRNRRTRTVRVLGRPSWSCSTEDQYDWTEDAAAALRAIVDLPAAQRQVITLCDIQCWPADEVCAAVGVSPANQRVLLHRARAEVRRRLRDLEVCGAKVCP